VDSVCRWIQEEVRRTSAEKAPLTSGKQPPLPYIFVTPQGMEIDLRLFN